ncbi:hypothetical protein CPB86DRAFT_785793, partial [Serendipita vermifera]
MDRLPIEVWRNVIYEVTNPGFRPHKKAWYGSVPSTLFVFMLVSRRWRQSILDMPLLWTTVLLDGDKEDSLARVKTCLELSKDLPLYLQIGVPVAGWDTIKDALTSNRQRIAIMRFYRRSLPFHYSREYGLESLENCIDDLLPLPKLTRLIVDIQTPKTLSLVPRLLKQCRSLVEIMGMNLTEDIFKLHRASRLRSLQTTENLLGLVKQRFPKLHKIKFTYSRVKPNEISTPVYPISTAQDISLISKLTSTMTLELPANGVALKELLYRLHSMTQLHHLNSKDALLMGSEIFPNFSLFPLDIIQSVDAYFEHVQELVLKALPSVEELTVTSSRRSPAQLYDSRTFPKLTNLSLRSSPSKMEPITLSNSIEKLYVSAPLYSDYFSGLSSPAVHHLVISSRLFMIKTAENNPLYHIEPEKWPALTSLTIPDSHLRIQGDAFIFLRALTITESCATRVTRICRDLAMHPTWLPALDHLQLFQLPEWDIFFIMLERHVTPLKAISLASSYPKELFGPIHSLLQGKFPSRPSNYDLSLSGNMELLCDNSITGCFLCIRSLLVCSTPLKTKINQSSTKMEPPKFPSPSEFPKTDSDILSTWEDRSQNLWATYMSHFSRINACSHHTALIPKWTHITSDSCPVESYSQYGRLPRLIELLPVSLAFYTTALYIPFDASLIPCNQVKRDSGSYN